ncbi:MAG: pro-sigmaK processing inhibitor BofA family protein [Defluviitaleaceae bacterium]|nr:pro-sigmaK processing inhibitor BofA family protein [Defluviitaleaceae bacterium]
MKSFMKAIFWVLKKSIFGFVSFYAFNFLGTFVGVNLTSHYLAYLLIGALGLPGLLIVYMVNLLFL